MSTERYELMSILTKKFPKMWMKESEEFGAPRNGIWTGEGSYDNDGCEMFNYYANPTSTLYDMGINKELVDILDEHGWFAEWYDSGTVLIYKQ